MQKVALQVLHQGPSKDTSYPHQVLTSFCSCKRAMLMWVRVGSASLRSAALPGGREAQVWGAVRSGPCCLCSTEWEGCPGLLT